MGLFYFLIIYILLLGLFISTVKKKSIRNKSYIFLTFGLLTVFVALRAENVGNDTVEYLRLFKSISVTNDLSVFAWRYETGYLYLNKLISLISSSSQAIIIVTSVITMFGFARFIYKNSHITWLSVYLFFTLGYYGMAMNTIRLNFAIVLVLFSYDFLKEKKLFKFIMTVALASMFHRTAIVFLLAWKITKLKFNYKTVISVVIGNLIIYIYFPIILAAIFKIFPIYQYYLGSAYLDGDVRLASVMNMLVGLSIILLGVFIRYYKKNNMISNELLNINNKSLSIKKEGINNEQLMLLFLVVAVSVTFLSFKFNLLSRISTYFLVFSIVYIPNVIKELKDKKLVNLIVFIVVVLFFIYATSIQIMRPEWNRIYPYNFFWQIL